MAAKIEDDQKYHVVSQNFKSFYVDNKYQTYLNVAATVWK